MTAEFSFHPSQYSSNLRASGVPPHSLGESRISDPPPISTVESILPPQSVSRSLGVVLRVDSTGGSRQIRPQDYALQCILVQRGVARFSIRGREYEVAAGTILWLVPTMATTFDDGRHYHASEDFSAWTAYFGPEVQSRASRNAATELMLNGVDGAVIVRRLTKVSARRLETQFEHLSTTDLKTEQFSVGLEYLLLSAWAEHEKATRISELADVHPAVEKAAYILRTQPETGSMQQLAHTCGASASWLSRLFRQQVGISLVGYRNQSRIERFFELYGEGNRRNLTQAAYAAGFGSYAQFHRVFKDALGYSPGELKRNPHEGGSAAARKAASDE